MQDSYPPDKTWGIVIFALSLLSVCIGGCIVGGGGLIGFLGTSAASSAHNADPAGGVAVAAISGVVIALGILVIATGVFQLVGGLLIMKSRRAGFLMSGICSAISCLSSLATLQPHSLINVVISGVIAYYCWARITGRMGPPVVR